MTNARTTKPAAAHLKVAPPALAETVVQVVRRRTLDLRGDLEPILGDHGLGLEHGEFNGLVEALARCNDLGLQIVLNVIALRAVHQERVVRYDPDGDDEITSSHIKKVDDDFF